MRAHLACIAAAILCVTACGANAQNLTITNVRILDGTGRVIDRGTATRTADAQGTVSASIAIPPPAGAPGCTPPTRSPVVTGNWLNFVVEDTTSGVSRSAGGLDVAT